MRIIIAIFLISIFSCVEHSKPSNDSIKATQLNIQKIEFQTILDSANVQGAILLFDPKKEEYYSNDFQWCASGQLPASTFKIPNSIIALETGIIENKQTLFKWNGEKRAFPIWEQDLNLKDAFHFSCVPCYKELARKIGVERMVVYTDKLDYGKMEVATNSIENFWLIGNSKINQFQQIDFLQRFQESQLPIKDRSEKIMKELMMIEHNKDYKISGKTGWSITENINNGWFVGYIEAKNQVFYFATNIEPKDDFDMQQFSKVRKTVTYRAFEEMEIMK